MLTLSPLNFGAAGGNLFSDITLDGRGSVIASRADIRVQSLQLAQLLPQLKIAKASVGEIDGRVKLVARGNSVAAMLGTATGDTTLAIGEGEVSDLMLRLSNLDVANSLLALMRGDRNIPIRCVVADLAFENGVMHPRQFVFDTAHTTLVGEGKANFADETLDLRLVAKPKGASLLVAARPDQCKRHVRATVSDARPGETGRARRRRGSSGRGCGTTCRNRAVHADGRKAGRAVRPAHAGGEAVDRAARDSRRQPLKAARKFPPPPVASGPVGLGAQFLLGIMTSATSRAARPDRA